MLYTPTSFSQRFSCVAPHATPISLDTFATEVTAASYSHSKLKFEPNLFSDVIQIRTEILEGRDNGALVLIDKCFRTWRPCASWRDGLVGSCHHMSAPNASAAEHAHHVVAAVHEVPTVHAIDGPCPSLTRILASSSERSLRTSGTKKSVMPKVAIRVCAVPVMPPPFRHASRHTSESKRHPEPEDQLACALVDAPGGEENILSLPIRHLGSHLDVTAGVIVAPSTR